MQTQSYVTWSISWKQRLSPRSIELDNYEWFAAVVALLTSIFRSHFELYPLAARLVPSGGHRQRLHPRGLFLGVQHVFFTAPATGSPIR